jgi:putative oxidoreductase
MKENCKCLDNPDAVLLAVRLVLAAVFIAHGWQKFQNMDGTIQFFGGVGLPAIVAYLVALGELGSGIAMLLGVWTHWAGKVIMLIMIGAIVFVKYSKGLVGGYELEFALFASALVVSAMGPGKYTIHSWMGKA